MRSCDARRRSARNSPAQLFLRAILRRNSLTRPPVPSQVLDLAERVTFTRQCEEAVNRGRPALEKFKGELLERLGQYTSLETDEPLVTLKVKALVLDLIHHMDVVDQLIAAGTSSAGEWQWRKQLRFGAGADGKVTIHMVSASFDYTYEYQGNAPKLVHTPLTDKCYLTLTQAMHMGALAGQMYTSPMYPMFYNAQQFDQPLNAWDTSRVTALTVSCRATHTSGGEVR